MFSFNSSKSHLLLIIFSLVVFKPSISFAYLSIGERINAKLLFVENKIADVSSKKAISDYKYVVMNRGTSDGIYESDHFSFYKNNKFGFRGVAVKVNLFRSMWLTYHNYTPGILEINSDFVAKKIHFVHLPKRVRNIRKVITSNIDSVFEDFSSSDSLEEQGGSGYGGGSNEEDNGRVKVVDKSDIFEFNPNLQLDELVRASKTSVDYFSWSLSASPISFSRVPRTKDLGYNIGISCLVCKDTTLELSYAYSHSTEKPPKSDFSEENEADIKTSSSYSASVDFTFNNIIGNASYWAKLQWTRARTADVVNNEPIYSPDYLWSGIPFGLSFNFISNDKIPEFSLRYGIQWDYEKVEFVDSAEDDQGNSISKKVAQKTQKTRHSFEVIFNYVPFENFNLTNTLVYSPLHDFSNKEFDWRDSGPLTNSLSISYQTSLDISLTYSNNITWDVITKERDGTPSTNMINSFEVTYNFNF